MKCILPFPFTLERLTQTSLAKYVMAEAPPQPPAGSEADFDRLKALLGAAQVDVNHVAMLYALIGVVFSTPAMLDELELGEPQALKGYYG